MTARDAWSKSCSAIASFVSRTGVPFATLLLVFLGSKWSAEHIVIPMGTRWLNNDERKAQAVEELAATSLKQLAAIEKLASNETDKIALLEDQADALDDLVITMSRGNDERAHEHSDMKRDLEEIKSRLDERDGG